MADAIDAQSLLEVPRCRAVLIGTSMAPLGEASHAEGSAPVVQFAQGTLRIFQLPPSVSDEAPRVVLAIEEAAGATLDEGFYYPILADMPVCKAGGRCLTLPDPDGGDNFGILFNEGGMEAVVDLLQNCGCRVWQQSDPAMVAALAQDAAEGPKHGKAATATAGAVQDAAAKATGAIKLAAGALSWGIRAATAEVKQSPLMKPTDKPVSVPPAVQQAAAAGRTGTVAVVHVSSRAVDSAAKLAAAMAGKASAVVVHAGSGASGNTGGWVADASLVGGSSVSAAVAVFLALNDAADQLVQESLGSTAELVGHKCGEEAGATTREGFHVVGNLMAAKSLLSKKALAKTVGKGAAVGAVRSAAASQNTGVATSPSSPPLNSGGGIRLGPQ